MALLVGLDVGSTTTKVYAMHEDMTEAWWGYRRHGACQTASVRAMLGELAERFPHESLRVAVTGSGARDIATALGASYVQEVVANALAISRFYPQTRCAIELGGQDAKMIFFRTNDKGDIEVADMRMNGSCAGGTGAFIDEMAKLMGVGTESGEFEQLASRGTTVHEVSGRCGVYAKTDIQPLLNEGIPTTDLALSALHAVARQTIGGLAQGIDIEPPVIFEGGTLAYNPTLVRVFREQLNLSDDQVIVPRDPQIMVARGAALSLTDMFASSQPIDLPDAFVRLDKLETVAPASGEGRLAQPFFATPAEQADFTARHGKETPAKGPDAYAPGETVRVALGIDSGSTTTKFALVDEAGELVDSFYASNNGRPLDVAQQGLVSLKNRWETAGVTLAIDAVGTTGYGEELFARAFHADYHTVETVAHARAACACVPDATFVLDIGGQDMKAIWLNHGVLTDIVVNEACSAGCGSFLEGFAKNLGIAVEDIATEAFSSKAPAVLGSRCTVFMNSSVVSEQRRGKGPGDIMAGLCRSIIENVFTKVIRVSNLNRLGDKVVVQGGTFRNDAVLRAFEQYLGKPVTRAPHPGLMGAIGIALLAREECRKGDAGTSFIGLDAVERFEHREFGGVTCRRCNNRPGCQYPSVHIAGIHTRLRREFEFALQPYHFDSSHRGLVSLVAQPTAGPVERLLLVEGGQYAERHRHIPLQHDIADTLRRSEADVIEVRRLALYHAAERNHAVHIGMFRKETRSHGEFKRARHVSYDDVLVAASAFAQRPHGSVPQCVGYFRIPLRNDNAEFHIGRRRERCLKM